MKMLRLKRRSEYKSIQQLFTICTRCAATTSRRHNTQPTASRMPSKGRNKVLIYCIAGIVTTAAASVAIRKWREDRMQQLPSAKSCGAFCLSAAHSSEQENVSRKHVDTPKRELNTLLTTTIRAGLMGGKKSVKEELECIRKWHQNHDFHGGLVVRELTQPLYYNDNNIVEGGDDVESIPIHQLNQRECYYLYYEVRPDGQVRQQIFCRGTTLTADVWTGLQSMLMYTYDDELECSLHKGFHDHANRLLEDLQPLLVSPPDSGIIHKRATVELCGHSLGGAVAIIMACKLQKRGYNVVRVTTVGAPRVCKWDAVPVLAKLLPKDTLRIEHELDAVCYLPPKGKGLFFRESLPYVGNKLLFVSKDTDFARYIPWEDAKNFKWVDSCLINGRVPEMVRSMPRAHKVPSYSEYIQRLIHTFENEQ